MYARTHARVHTQVHMRTCANLRADKYLWPVQSQPFIPIPVNKRTPPAQVQVQVIWWRVVLDAQPCRANSVIPEGDQWTALCDISFRHHLSDLTCPKTVPTLWTQAGVCLDTDCPQHCVRKPDNPNNHSRYLSCRVHLATQNQFTGTSILADQNTTL